MKPQMKNILDPHRYWSRKLYGLYVCLWRIKGQEVHLRGICGSIDTQPLFGGTVYSVLQHRRSIGQHLSERIMTDLLEVPGIALLVVSDNSATGNALVGRSEQEQEIYERAKTELLPKAILEVCKVG